ncbi:MAG: hypothetical protein H7146_04640 [Burkholderiaceae bacterium]|nr:hypothetical protein [Microbacteriaceae bacterium]
MPSAEMIEAAVAGLIAIANPFASHGDNTVAYRCRATGCGHEWGVIDWEA